ncbi:fasciclin domain-containing protein [Mucilaginibacter yixingensis]|uniref:Fasciclin domain-containing protein n=1 Tax=Mucilaginibacter yixingensis TaxID=1295612 RepID=A0A2T5JBL2_9SPHI|nr:fasciclin domain-containing protein [Mucilaginibacter yixingensis]PTQ98253.1 fasciclin domain-containing protein [Mucilaginibacter yixingensis]
MIPQFIRRLVLLATAVVLVAGCRKKAFDDFYGRPATLQPPIYNVLDSRKNFTTFLTLIDKSGYKKSLSGGGYWTLFAPNDAAFQKYFTDNNTTLANIDSATARKIVQYCLVYNDFETTHIADYQSDAGWVPNAAFKRMTNYYDGFYKGQGPDGSATVLLSSNRNQSTNGSSFVFGDNNNKYIPFFYSSYMSAMGLSAADYNAFYPNSTYTGFNVDQAQVVNKDLIAENGVVHEIDRVLTPLPNLEQYLATNSQYSEFRKLFEQYMTLYIPNVDATARYKILTGSSSTVYIKQYSPLLAYAPNNENYVKANVYDAQSDGYTMVAPNNTALTQYLNSVILEFYGTVDKLPASIIADLLNAHMYNTTAWPSKFATTPNFQNETSKLSFSADLAEKKMCSNGIFYGSNKVQQANVFSTVYARAYLDPNYSLMWRILNNLKLAITSPTQRYTIFMLPDTYLRALGYDYNTTTNAFTLTVNGTVVAGGDQLQRLVNLHVINTPNNELNSLAGSGILETYGGEYMKWNAGQIFAAGNVETGVNATVGASRDYINGRIYYLNSGNLIYPTGTLASQIAKLAKVATDPYYDFYQYLINSTAYNAVSAEFSFTVSGANYTIFIPTKAAILQAVKDGYLPGTVSGTTVTPTYNPTSIDDKAKVTKFIQYHIINGVAMATDGKKSSVSTAFQTFLVNSLGDKLTITVKNQPNNMTVTDNFGRTSNVVNGSASNYLGSRALFHQIDNYLKYNF